MVLAVGSLDVPPILLIFPLGRTRSVEVLPEHYYVSPWDAIQWFIGHSILPEAAEPTDPDDYKQRVPSHANAVLLYEQHSAYVKTLARSMSRAHAAAERGAENLAHEQHYVGAHIRGFRGLREQMREMGLIPPPLDDYWAETIGEEDYEPTRDPDPDPFINLDRRPRRWDLLVAGWDVEAPGGGPEEGDADGSR